MATIAAGELLLQDKNLSLELDLLLAAGELLLAAGELRVYG